jgi:hypothetical protein
MKFATLFFPTVSLYLSLDGASSTCWNQLPIMPIFTQNSGIPPDDGTWPTHAIRTRRSLTGRHLAYGFEQTMIKLNASGFFMKYTSFIPRRDQAGGYIVDDPSVTAIITDFLLDESLNASLNGVVQLQTPQPGYSLNVGDNRELFQLLDAALNDEMCVRTIICWFVVGCESGLPMWIDARPPQAHGQGPPAQGGGEEVPPGPNDPLQAAPILNAAAAEVPTGMQLDGVMNPTERIVYRDRVVNVPVDVVRFVERIVNRDVVREVDRIVDRLVEVPVDRLVEVPVDRLVEVLVEVPQPPAPPPPPAVIAEIQRLMAAFAHLSRDRPLDAPPDDFTNMDPSMPIDPQYVMRRLDTYGTRLAVAVRNRSAEYTALYDRFQAIQEGSITVPELMQIMQHLHHFFSTTMTNSTLIFTAEMSLAERNVRRLQELSRPAGAQPEVHGGDDAPQHQNVGDLILTVENLTGVVDAFMQSMQNVRQVMFDLRVRVITSDDLNGLILPQIEEMSGFGFDGVSVTPPIDGSMKYFSIFLVLCQVCAHLDAGHAGHAVIPFSTLSACLNDLRLMTTGPSMPGETVNQIVGGIRDGSIQSLDLPVNPPEWREFAEKLVELDACFGDEVRGCFQQKPMLVWPVYLFCFARETVDVSDISSRQDVMTILDRFHTRPTDFVSEIPLINLFEQAHDVIVWLTSLLPRDATQSMIGNILLNLVQRRRGGGL